MAEPQVDADAPATPQIHVPWRWQLAWYGSKAALCIALLILLLLGWREAISRPNPWKDSHQILGIILACLALWLVLVVCCYPKRCLRHWYRKHHEEAVHG